MRKQSKTDLKILLVIIAIIAMLGLWGKIANANGGSVDMSNYDTITLTKTSDPAPYCPITKMSDNDSCLKCHVLKKVDGKPTFALQEIPRDAGYDLPWGTEMVTYDEDKLALYYVNTSVNCDKIQDIRDYMYDHPEFTRFIMEIQSPGGSVLSAWKAVGILREMANRGIEIETRCYGFALSAGGILLTAGDVGKRFVNPHAEIMLHKVWTFAMFKLDDPDTAEDQAALLKHLQDNINDFFISRTRLTKEQLASEMFKRDWWMTGREAVEHGIADGFIQ